MKSNFYKNYIERFLCSLLILTICISLYGCSNNESTDSNVAENDLESGLNQKTGEELEKDSTKNNTTDKNSNPAIGDNTTIALEFVNDLIDFNFDRLLQAYPYDDNMKKAMASEDTKKMLVFNQAEYGEVLDIKTPYNMAYGIYDYVMVPIVGSVESFNYKITFDVNHNIIGFTFADYLVSDESSEKEIPDNVVETEFSFNSEGYVIPGTFTAPKEGTDFPVVILVQGSGPSDRDESIYENKPFRDIAWALAEEGIASYRYDKRSYLYAEQVSKDKSFTIYDEIINDVVAAKKLVTKLENVDDNRVYVLGHSLSGYVMPRIAEAIPDAAGFIMMSAPAEHIKEFIMKQLNYLANEDKVVTLEEQKNISETGKQVEMLKAPEKIKADQVVLGAYKNYWLDLKSYNALEDAEKITAPVLVLQGERDYQVTLEQFYLWKGAFDSYSNWTFNSYPILNHFMMAGKGAPSSAEYKKKSNVDEQVIKDIIKFIGTTTSK